MIEKHSRGSMMQDSKRNGLSRRSVIGAAASCLGAGVLPWSPAIAQNSPIRIGEGIALAWAPFFVASAKETWQANGLTPNVVQFASGRLVLDAVIGGNVDIGTASESPVVFAALNGLPVRVIGVFNVEENMELVARQTIKTPADLAGKKVGYARGTASHYYLSKLLAKYGVPASSVTQITLNPPEMVSALAGGSIDAFVWQEPQLSLAVAGAPATLHRLAEPGLNAIFAVVLTTKDAIDTRRSTLVRGLRALDDAIRLMGADPEASIKTSAERVKMDVKIAQQAWRKMRIELTLDKPALVEEMTKQARWAMDNDYVRPGTRMPDFNSVVDTTLLAEVRSGK